MPLYDFRCIDCGKQVESLVPAEWVINTTVRCEACGGPMQRVYTFPHFKRTTIEARYNPSVGKPIRNTRQLKDELKRAGEEATLRTGVEHDYEPVDLRDTEKLGVTEEGLEATRRQQVKDGQLEVKTWL